MYATEVYSYIRVYATFEPAFYTRTDTLDNVSEHWNRQKKREILLRDADFLRANLL